MGKDRKALLYIRCGLVHDKALISIREYQSKDRKWIKETNLRFYQEVHGFDASFADAINASLDLLDRQQPLTTSKYLVAEAKKQPIGHVFLSAERPQIGRIRLFYLEPEFRGQGMGLRLLRRVITAANEVKFQKVYVSTFDQHPEACRLYEKFGFEARATTMTKAFGKAMKQIDFELSLGPTIQPPV